MLRTNLSWRDYGDSWCRCRCRYAGAKNIFTYIEEHEKTKAPINGVSNIMKNRVFEEMDVPVFTDRTRASLKIQEGCNNFCTFCIIPWSRGLLRSRDPENVIEQANKLVEAGYKELVLTGIHTAGYGEDLKDYNFAMLLGELEQVEGLERIRISSIEASQITDEVIRVLDRSKKLSVTCTFHCSPGQIRY